MTRSEKKTFIGSSLLIIGGIGIIAAFDIWDGLAGASFAGGLYCCINGWALLLNRHE